MTSVPSLVSFFKNKKVLVTGHTGFKGTWLTTLLLHLRAEVIGYSLAPNTSPSLYPIIENLTKNYISDIRDYQSVKSMFERETPEIVFHLAAQPLVRVSYDDPIYTYSTNAMGTANILECVRRAKEVKSVVIITTDKVYETAGVSKSFVETDPLGGYDPYSTSKVCAEFITSSYILSYFSNKNSPRPGIATARAGNVIGGGDWSKDRLFPDLVRSIFENEDELILRQPKSIRPWQHVLDPLFGYLNLSQKLYNDPNLCGAWNFGPDQKDAITVEDIVRRSIQTFGSGSYSVFKDESKHETKTLRLNSNKANLRLGWKAILGLDKYINWTVNWYRDFYSGSDPSKLTTNQILAYIKLLGR